MADTPRDALVRMLHAACVAEWQRPPLHASGPPDHWEYRHDHRAGAILAADPEAAQAWADGMALAALVKALPQDVTLTTRFVPGRVGNRSVSARESHWLVGHPDLPRDGRGPTLAAAATDALAKLEEGK